MAWHRALRALPFVVLFVWLVILIGNQPPIMNNGDYWRTALETMKFPFMRSLRWDCFPVVNGEVNWSSTTSIIYFAQVKAAHFLGFDCFSLRFMFLPLTVLYLAGAVLFIWLSSNAWVATAMALTPAVLFGEFFGSIYEESAVLTLAPWLMFSALALRRNSKGWILFGVVAVLLIYSKSQNLLLVPALCALFYWGLPDVHVDRLKKSVLLSVLLLMVAFASIRTHQQNILPNAYNRVFNGLGWTAQGVSSWPVNEFFARKQHFEAHKEELQRRSLTAEPIDGLVLMGTSFWPYGQNIFEAGRDPQLVDQARVAVSLPSYVHQIWSHGIGATLLSVYQVATRSDFSLRYLKGTRQGLLGHRDTILTQLGYVLAGLTFVMLVMSRTPVHLLLVGTTVMAPLFVFIGDGYYEFEKHLIPYIMVFPVFFLPYAGRKPSA